MVEDLAEGNHGRSSAEMNNEIAGKILTKIEAAQNRSPNAAYDDPLHTRGYGTIDAGANPGDVWNIPPVGYEGAHFAVYPEELCERVIKAACPEHGVVLDPFAGSGTTLAVAHRLGRKFIGVEMNPEYIALAKRRIRGARK